MKLRVSVRVSCPFIGCPFLCRVRARTKRDPPMRTSRSNIPRGALVSPPLPKPNLFSPTRSGASCLFLEQDPGIDHAPLFRLNLLPRSVPMHMANIGAALKRLPPGIARSGQARFCYDRSGNGTTPVQLRRWLDIRQHFDGLTGIEATSQRSRMLRSSSGPKTIYRTADYSTAHGILLSRTRKTIGATVIYPWRGAKTIGYTPFHLLIKRAFVDPYADRSGSTNFGGF